jgi:hypothetical protein
MGKKKIFKSFFSGNREQIFFLQQVLLVSYVKLCEIYDKKRKKLKTNFHMAKKTAKCSLVILSALVIHTAPTVSSTPPPPTNPVEVTIVQGNCSLLTPNFNRL